MYFAVFASIVASLSASSIDSFLSSTSSFSSQIDEAMELFRKFLALVTGENRVDTGLDLAELKTLSGVSNFPTRVKCATLAWHAMVGALNGIDEDIKTE